jgi:hypothetical protein
VPRIPMVLKCVLIRTGCVIFGTFRQAFIICRELSL